MTCTLPAGWKLAALGIVLGLLFGMSINAATALAFFAITGWTS